MANNDNKNYSIYISGVGGQGIIKTSVIIGEAAMLEGYDVVMSEIHGMSQRGGSVSTELKIGNFKSSIVEEGKADLILAFEPIEVLRGLNKANKDTTLIFNSSFFLSLINFLKLFIFHAILYHRFCILYLLP